MMDTATEKLLNEIIPIFCVVLGIVIERSLGWFHRKSEIRNTGENFITQIEIINFNIPKQVEFIYEYAKSIVSNTPGRQTLELSANLRSNRINALNMALVQKYIKKRIKNKHNAFKVLDHFYASINIIETTMERLSKEFELNIKKTDEVRTIISKNCYDINAIIGKWGAEKEIQRYDFNTDEFGKYIKEVIFIKMVKLNEVEAVAVNEYLFSEFMGKCLTNINHSLGTELLPLVRDCYRVCNDLRHSMDASVHSLGDLAMELQQQKEDLNQLLNKNNLS